MTTAGRSDIFAGLIDRLGAERVAGIVVKALVAHGVSQEELASMDWSSPSAAPGFAITAEKWAASFCALAEDAYRRAQVSLAEEWGPPR